MGADLSRLASVVRADVLDAWFPPCPAVLELFRTASADLIATSPPEAATPLVKALSTSRGIPGEAILTAGGSSALIYGALPRFALDARRMVVLNPTYGEYAHVARNLLGIPVAEVPIPHPFCGEELVTALLTELRPGDVLVLVNPNSPTGTHLTLEEARNLLDGLPLGVRVWLDETYIEYVGANHSLERLAATSPSMVVCKSMSKVFALSGLRVAYLVGSPARIGDLRRGIPPWSVSLPAMLAGIAALDAPDYYARRLGETHSHRRSLSTEIGLKLGWEVQEGSINCVLTRPAGGIDPEKIIAGCAEQGVYLRGGAAMGGAAREWIRISVRSPGENIRIAIAMLGAVHP